MEQFNNLVKFRQTVYNHGLTQARDAQFELLDALLLSSPVRSFPELSLSPVFRCKRLTAYAAIKTTGSGMAGKLLHPPDSDEGSPSVCLGKLSRAQSQPGISNIRYDAQKRPCSNSLNFDRYPHLLSFRLHRRVIVGMITDFTDSPA